MRKLLSFERWPPPYICFLFTSLSQPPDCIVCKGEENHRPGDICVNGAMDCWTHERRTKFQLLDRKKSELMKVPRIEASLAFTKCTVRLIPTNRSLSILRLYKMFRPGSLPLTSILTMADSNYNADPVGEFHVAHQCGPKIRDHMRVSNRFIKLKLNVVVNPITFLF